MSICVACKAEKLGDGCGSAFVWVNGMRYPRIKCGSEMDIQPDVYGKMRCPDCGARRRHFHHANCEGERCPVGGGQLFMCGCDVEYETPAGGRVPAAKMAEGFSFGNESRMRAWLDGYRAAAEAFGEYAGPSERAGEVNC